jgi:hypothetical protein
MGRIMSKPGAMHFANALAMYHIVAVRLKRI